MLKKITLSLLMFVIGWYSIVSAANNNVAPENNVYTWNHFTSLDQQKKQINSLLQEFYNNYNISIKTYFVNNDQYARCSKYGDENLSYCLYHDEGLSDGIINIYFYWNKTLVYVSKYHFFVVTDSHLGGQIENSINEKLKKNYWSKIFDPYLLTLKISEDVEKQLINACNSSVMHLGVNYCCRYVIWQTWCKIHLEKTQKSIGRYFFYLIITMIALGLFFFIVKW